MLDMERCWLELRSRRTGLRWWFPRAHFLGHCVPCDRALLGQTTRLRNSIARLQAAQHLLRCSWDRLPLGRVVRFQRRLGIGCEVSVLDVLSKHRKLIGSSQSASRYGNGRHQPGCQCRRIDMDVHGLEARAQVVRHRFLQWRRLRLSRNHSRVRLRRRPGIRCHWFRHRRRLQLVYSNQVPLAH